MTTPSLTHHTCVVVDTVTSSRPSSPRKTAASLPRSAKTPARSGAMRASAQPTAAYVGWAGLVSGPRKLNAVPMPRSRRGTAVWRKDGWKVCAKQNVMPASDATSTTRSGGSDRSTPRASSTSAEPDDDEAARLPCLTSRTPGSRSHHRGHRRDVHGVGAVATRADDVEARARDVDPTRVGEHLLGQAPHLVDALALGAQPDEKARDLGGRGLPAHDLGHGPLGRRPVEVTTGDEVGEQ